MLNELYKPVGGFLYTREGHDRGLGFPLNESTVEEFYGTLMAYLEAEHFTAPEEFYNEAQLLYRRQGRLSTELAPAHLRVAAMAAALQGCLGGSYADVWGPFDPRKHVR